MALSSQILPRLIVAWAIEAPQESTAPSVNAINLMQAARLSTKRFLIPTMKVLKMQIYKSGIVGISREVVRGKRRISA